MAEVETSAKQYAPVRDAEGYLDSKGGVPNPDAGAAGTQGRARKSRRRLESAVEAERHGAEVGNEAKKQRRHKADQG